MLHTLKKHLRKELECLLFWLGGIITILWIRLLALEAYSRNTKGHVLTSEMTIFYILTLAFCLGIKGVRKRLNHDTNTDESAGVEETTDHKQKGLASPEHNYGDNQYLGEIWAAFLLVASFIIIHDYISGGFSFVRPVEKIPDQLIFTNLGVVGLFGVTKVIDIWTIIAKFVQKRGVA